MSLNRKHKRKICFFTGSRAEYGLLKPVMQKLRKDQGVALQLIVSGSHLSKDFGMTVREIEKDGFHIYKRISILTSSNSEVGVGKSIGLGVSKTSEFLNKLRPDILVILGDRYEALAAAVSALVLNIPIAHIHGGETTTGAIDEAIRHSITKMSHLHFTATTLYRRRVIQLGENPERVFNVGAVGVENVRKLHLLSHKKLENILKLKLNRRNLLVTFHPVTIEGKASLRHFKNLLAVLATLKDTSVIFTKANADAYGKDINQMIDAYVRAHRRTAYVFSSLGQKLYFSTMRHVDGVVGNSSSGILEAPSLKTGTVNIGDRQKGRMRAQSIVDCHPTPPSIRKAIKKLYSPAFKKKLRSTKNPYESKSTANKIARILRSHKLTGILKKEFFNAL